MQIKTSLSLGLALAMAATAGLRAEEAAAEAAPTTAAQPTPQPKNDAPGSVTMGNQLNDEGKHAEAANYLEGIGEQVAANGLKKREQWRQVALSNAYIGLGEFDKAIAAAQRALELDPVNAPAWNNLGAAQAQSAKREDAVATYEKAIAALKEAGKDTSKMENNLAELLAKIEEGKPKAQRTAEAKAKMEAEAAKPAEAAAETK